MVEQFDKGKSEELFTLTYGVRTLTHRGGFSLRLYSKQNAMDSSSLSHRRIVFHVNSTVCDSSVPSSRHAINRKLLIPEIWIK